jgi:uncharacterized membrane-anchored protein
MFALKARALALFGPIGHGRVHFGRAGLLLCALIAGALLGPATAFADGHGNPGPDVAQPPPHQAPAPTTAPPQGRQGDVSLMEGALKLSVPAKYRYYSAEDAYAFLQRNGQAAPACTVLGMVAPADERIDRPGAWGTIVGFKDIGYVPASTAAGLSAPNFEADVRAARQTQNLPFEGFAAQPAFDANAQGLSWAERSNAPGSGGKDLRYEQDKLGRRGVACMTSVGSADQMPAITAAAPDIIHMVSFAPGQAYSDYAAGTDTISAFTVPALVTGVAPAAPQQVAAVQQSSVDNTQGGFAGLAGYFPWIALGVVVLAALGFMMTRRKKEAEPEA